MKFRHVQQGTCQHRPSLLCDRLTLPLRVSKWSECFPCLPCYSYVHDVILATRSFPISAGYPPCHPGSQQAAAAWLCWDALALRGCASCSAAVLAGGGLDGWLNLMVKSELRAACAWSGTVHSSIITAFRVTFPPASDTGPGRQWATVPSSPNLVHACKCAFSQCHGFNLLPSMRMH